MDGGTMGDGTDAKQRFIRIGRSGVGTFNQTGGDIELGNQFNSAIEVGINEGSTGTYNFSGGSASMQRITVGMEGSGTLNLSGTAELTANEFGTLTLVGGDTPTGQGTVNLDGGLLTVNQIQTLAADPSVSESIFNFNGGTLRPFSGSLGATFMQGLTEVNILSGGAFIDTDGFNITIAQAFQGDGDLTKLGEGTLTLASDSNASTGGLIIEEGTVSIEHASFLDSSATINIFDGATLDMDFADTLTVSALILDGEEQVIGTYDASTSGAFLSGDGTISVIPEPSGVMLFGLALLTAGAARRRRSFN